MIDLFSVPNTKRTVTSQDCLVFLLISTLLIILLLHESILRRISERKKKINLLSTPNCLSFDLTATGKS